MPFLDQYQKMIVKQNMTGLIQLGYGPEEALEMALDHEDYLLPEMQKRLRISRPGGGSGASRSRGAISGPGGDIGSGPG